VRLSPPPLRTANGHDRDERRASWVELFFDLVFAGAVGQLAGALQDHPALGGLARFAMLFTPIWWLWVMFTFYADRHESRDTAHRAAHLSAMLLCVALAASAPRAVRPDHGFRHRLLLSARVAAGPVCPGAALSARHQGLVRPLSDVLRRRRDPVAGGAETEINASCLPGSHRTSLRERPCLLS
jgi:hypothetical protein